LATKKLLSDFSTFFSKMDLKNVNLKEKSFKINFIAKTFLPFVFTLNLIFTAFLIYFSENPLFTFIVISLSIIAYSLKSNYKYPIMIFSLVLIIFEPEKGLSYIYPIIIGMSSYLMLMVYLKKKKINFRKIDVLVLSFLVSLFSLSIYHSNNQEIMLAFFNPLKYNAFSSMLIVIFYACIFLYIIFMEKNDTNMNFNLIMESGIVFFIFCAGYAIFQYFLFLNMAHSFFRSQNTLGFVFNSIGVFIFYFILRKKKCSIPYYVIAALFLLSLTMTFSRSAIAAFIFFIFVYVLKKISLNKKKGMISKINAEKKIYVIVIAILVMVFVSLFFSIYFAYHTFFFI
jgi:hypothetical protein